MTAKEFKEKICRKKCEHYKNFCKYNPKSIPHCETYEKQTLDWILGLL